MAASSTAEKTLWLALPCLLLGALLLQVALPLSLFSASCDEVTHLPSGYTYLKTGDFRLNPQHPPLIKELCALPLLFLGPRLDLTDPSWTSRPPNEWAFGQKFLDLNDADRLLFWGRVPVLLLCLLLGLYVFIWARGLYGNRAACFALFLYAFCPNVVAHSRFVTMDVGLACFSVITLYHLWRYVGGAGWGHLAACGSGLGLALASKFSAVILVPIVAALLGLAALIPSRTPAGRTAPFRLGRAGLTFLALVGAAFVIVQATYFFPGDLLVYWRGLMQVNRDHVAGYAFYLRGAFKPGGWWYYFLAAGLVKTPVPTILSIVAAALLLKRYPRSGRLDLSFLLVPAVAFFVVTSLLADNLGIRYLLPLYPLVMIFASWPVTLVRRGALQGVIFAVLGLWLIADAVRIYPDHLAYFNTAAGGASNGYKYLDDSNIDWGADLKRLKAYQDEHQTGRIKLHYEWTASPDYYHLDYEKVSRSDWEEKPSPGFYAISTQLLIRGKYFERTLGVHTDWLDRYEPVGRVGYGFYLFKF